MEFKLTLRVCVRGFVCVCVRARISVSVCPTLSTVARQLSGRAINQNMTSAKLNRKKKKKNQTFIFAKSKLKKKSNESRRALGGLRPGRLQKAIKPH